MAPGLTVEIHVVGEAAAPGDEADILLAPHRLADAELLDAVHWRILAFRDPRALSGLPQVGAHDRQRAWRASTRQRGESAMRVAVFSTKPYDRTFLDRANAAHGHRLDYHEARLTPATAALIGDADAEIGR